MDFGSSLDKRGIPTKEKDKAREKVRKSIGNEMEKIQTMEANNNPFLLLQGLRGHQTKHSSTGVGFNARNLPSGEKPTCSVQCCEGNDNDIDAVSSPAGCTVRRVSTGLFLT